MRTHPDWNGPRLLAVLLVGAGLLLPASFEPARGARSTNLTTINTADQTPDFVLPGADNVTILSFTLRDRIWNERFTLAQVNYTGTALSDIAAAHVFLESGSLPGTFDRSQDTLLGSNQSVSTNPVNITLDHQIPRNNNQKFYIVLNVAGSAGDGDAVDARINADGLTVAGATWPDAPYDPAGSTTVDRSPPGNWAFLLPPGWTSSLAPDCSVNASDLYSGLNVSSAEYEFSSDGGGNWSGWRRAECTGANGTNASQRLTARSVPFSNSSADQNLIRFRVSDVLGQNGTSPDLVVQIDALPPGNWTLASPEGWYTSDQRPDITAAVEDGLSGLDGGNASAEYSTNGGLSWAPVENVTCSRAGAATANLTVNAPRVPFDHDSGTLNRVRFNISDIAGNWNASPEFTVGIDSTPPGAPVLGALPEYTRGYSVDIAWGPVEDEVSGLDRYLAECDDSADFSSPLDIKDVGNASACAFTDLLDGTRFHFRVIAGDRAGLTGRYSNVVNTTLDATPPLTLLSTLPATPDGADGWFVNLSAVLLEARDATSGVALTRASIDGGPGENYTGPISLVGDGEHRVEFWSEDQVGNREATRTVTVKLDRTPPTAIMALPNAVYANESASFNGSASADAVQHVWSFGDGSPAQEGPAVDHAFTRAGTFWVALTVVDRAGLTCTTRQEVKVLVRGVNYPPVAYIYSTPTIFTGAPVTFSGNQSQDEDPATLRFEWDFGDGSSGYGVTIAHTFSAEGTYTVRLKVTDRGGLWDSVYRAVKVFVEGTNQPPLALIVVRGTAYVDEPVVLDGANSSDESLDTCNFTWDLGDGTLAHGIRISHVYAMDAVFIVRLTVTDVEGLSGSTSYSLRVFQRGFNLPPEAQFRFLPYSPRSGQTVEFDASATRDELVSELSFSWDFGDGLTGQGKLVNHRYGSSGTYEVKLTVRDTGGLTDTYATRVHISETESSAGLTALAWGAIFMIAVGMVAIAATLAASLRRKKDLVVPAVAPKKIEIEKGLNHLIDAEDPAGSYEALGRLASKGMMVLVITHIHPKKIPKPRSDRNFEVFWLSEIGGDEPSFDPSKMEYEMAEKMISFMKEERDNGVVLLDGVDLLVQRHGFPKVLEFIHNINEVASVNEATMIVQLNSRAMKEVEFNQLKRKFDRWT